MKVKDLINRLLKYGLNTEVTFSFYVQDDPNHILIYGKFDDTTIMIRDHSDQGENDEVEIYNAYIRKV